MVPALVALIAALASCSTDATSANSIATDTATAERGGFNTASVTVTIDSARITVGHWAHVTAVARNSKGYVLTGKTYTWSTTDPNMAWVSDGGKVITTLAGTVSIRATVDGVTGNAALVIVNPGTGTGSPVASVTVALDSTALMIPHTAQATATLKDAGGNVLGGSVTWSSSNAAVASVSSTGVITAVAAGTADIIGASGTVTGKAAITITAPVASVGVTVASASVKVGSTTQATATTYDSYGNVLTGRAVTWSSSNSAIATVSATGVVTGVASGAVSIMAMSEGKTGATSVTVTAIATTVSVATVTVSLGSASINTGATTQATAVAKDASGNVITGSAIAWSSSNTAVATVNASTGVVTGVAAGTSSIMATSGGKTGSASVTVTSPTGVAASTVSLASASINVGATTQATAVVRDASGNVLLGKAIAWSSTNTAVATVNGSTGLVTGVAAGTASITANWEGGSGSATVTVSGTAATIPVATVAVSLASASINTGATTQATAVTKDASGNVLTGSAIAWSSSNTAVATVNASTGVVTGVAAGTASITATSGGKTGSASVTVATTVASIASISVSLSSGSITTGSTSTASAVAKDASGNVLTGRAITWTSSNITVATVSSSGVVTGVTPGSASITATSGSITGSAPITVSSPLVIATGNSSIKGTVTDASGLPAGGGYVEVLSGSTIIRTVAVPSTGIYQVDTLPAGTYGVRLQPSLAYSMGPSEPPQYNVSISTGGSVTQSFKVQQALYSDNFQTYSATSQLTGPCAGTMTAGSFWSTATGDLTCVSPNNIFLDAAAPGGAGKAMRYDWPARPTSGISGNWTVALMPRAHPITPGSTIYVRWTDMLSPNFKIGGAGAVGSELEYKYLFLDFFPSGGGSGTLAFELDSQTSTPSNLVVARTKLVDFVSTATQSWPNDTPLGASFMGVWHTWVAEVTGIGTANITFTLYLDGNRFQSITGPFFPNRALSGMMTVELGANINNGPDQTQSRWFREFGIYTTRPSMKPLF